MVSVMAGRFATPPMSPVFWASSTSTARKFNFLASAAANLALGAEAAESESDDSDATVSDEEMDRGLFG